MLTEPHCKKNKVLVNKYLAKRSIFGVGNIAEHRVVQSEAEVRA